MRCFVLVIVPKHKYADRWAGPYRITEKLSDYLYVVDIKGVKKVVNISKMKAYKPNRYSQLDEKTAHGKIPVKDVDVGKNAKKSKKTRKLSESSDEEDQDVIISIYSQVRK